jgi:hypothetical protein
MLLIIIWMKSDNVGNFSVAKPFQALTGFRIPEFHLTIISARQESTPVIGEREILDRLHMTVERAKAVLMSINVPKLTTLSMAFRNVKRHVP